MNDVLAFCLANWYACGMTLAMAVCFSFRCWSNVVAVIALFAWLNWAIHQPLLEYTRGGYLPPLIWYLTWAAIDALQLAIMLWLLHSKKEQPSWQLLVLSWLFVLSVASQIVRYLDRYHYQDQFGALYSVTLPSLSAAIMVISFSLAYPGIKRVIGRAAHKGQNSNGNSHWNARTSGVVDRIDRQ